MDLDIDSLINGGLAFATVLALMALNVPVGISMLFVGFVGFIDFEITNLRFPRS